MRARARLRTLSLAHARGMDCEPTPPISNPHPSFAPNKLLAPRGRRACATTQGPVGAALAALAAPAAATAWTRSSSRILRSRTTRSRRVLPYRQRRQRRRLLRRRRAAAAVLALPAAATAAAAARLCSRAQCRRAASRPAAARAAAFPGARRSRARARARARALCGEEGAFCEQGFHNTRQRTLTQPRARSTRRSPRAGRG